MKTDSIFYQMFQAFPGIFFELIGQPSSNGNGYTFQSVEIKEVAKRIDGIFVPSGRSRQPIYFVEVQFQRDDIFYYRFFTEIFLYLGQNKPNRDWRAVAVFSRRSIDREVPIEYQRLLLSQQVQWVYLDELEEAGNQSVGLGMVQLVVEDEDTAQAQVRQLIQKAQQELEDEAVRQKILELIETILVYKFPRVSRQEIEAMFGLSDLKQTRVYQEAKEEGKLEAVPRFLKLGLTLEQIAEGLELDIEAVRKIAQEQSDKRID
ncbi:Rpn family recombination-promoting nuclease/putative transposase [Coleofasciculus sp. H7-2]|uniref:Rpn family recombination-promoting nuclease/putative transposase n=1 Tax=Coleofasciculus sp. H7-2 TaxID=3351545 RepID=UPI00366CF897